jgi:DNA-binding IclR family transcriptional regulator
VIQVIARAAAILRALEARPEGRTLGELSSDVELPRSTVHRIVRALEQEHLVAAVSSEGGYRLGPGLMRLASSSSRWLADQVHQHLRALSRLVNETVDLSIRSGDRVLFIDQIAVSQRLQAVSGIGVGMPLHCTAPGKALLAEMPDEEVDELLADGAVRHTENTIVDLDELKEVLAEIRRTGVALDREEHHLGISAVGAVIRNPYGLPAAVSIPVPSSRFEGREGELSEALISARAAIEADLAS